MSIFSSKVSNAFGSGSKLKIFPSLSTTSVSFSQAAPTFVKPAVSLDFAQVNTYIDTNEDIELLADFDGLANYPNGTSLQESFRRMYVKFNRLWQRGLDINIIWALGLSV